ncbi:MAG: putative sugar nucleotidyl transferase [Phycisphaerales bacterium]
MTQAIFFDDGRGLLSPLTDLRAAFNIRTGALTTIDRWMLRNGMDAVGLFVPEPLAALTAECHPGVSVNQPLRDASGSGAVLAINGRCVLPLPAALGLAVGECIIESSSGHLVAACVPHADVPALAARGWMPHGLHATSPTDHVLLERPWHIRAFRDAALDIDLPLLVAAIATVAAPPQAIVIPGHALTIAKSAKVYPGVILDTEAGPIVIDEHAVIRPGASIVGPAYIGPHSTVLDRALIKARTAIGPWCKVAGEVGGTIFQGFANKGHDGHLGDSWVGEWANLGAGTTNSNLLNTYGEVTCRAFHLTGEPGQNERTGQQFLGAVIGDHVKTAICTRLMTGCIVGTGSMLAASAAAVGTIERFSWCTDAGIKPFRHDKFIEVAAAAMARRKVAPSAAYMARLAALVR